MKRLREYFEGISQSLFLKDALFGTFLLAALAFCAPSLFLAGFLASLAGFVYSVRFSTPYLLKHHGLMTVNGFFFGIAMASHFGHGSTYWFFLITGSLALPLLTQAIFEVLQHWKLSPFIAPSIAMAWFVALAGPATGLEAAPLAATHMDGPVALAIAQSAFTSLGRMLFVPNGAFGVALFGLLLAFSPRRAGCLLFGVVIATLVACAVVPEEGAWAQGQYGFCAALVGLGLSSFPEKFGFKTIALFCAFSVLATMAAARLLGTLGLPLLNAPYVLTLWIACLSRVPKHPISWAPTERPAPEPALALIVAGAPRTEAPGTSGAPAKRVPNRVT